MKPDRKAAIIVGVLFLLGFAGAVTAVIAKPLLDSLDYLVRIAADHDAIIIGEFFQIVMAFAVAGIAIFLYPVLKKYDEGLALGAVGFRLIEGTLFIIAAIAVLSLIPLSEEFVRAGADVSHVQIAGGLLQSISYWSSQIFAPIAWCVGALMYYYIFYKSRLIPRWLSMWGLIGAVLFLSGALLMIFGIIDSFSPVQIASSVPIALQEFVLAIWLIIKGFDLSTAKTVS